MNIYEYSEYFSQPSADALFHILNSILSQHLENPTHKFTKQVTSLCEPLVRTAIVLHQKIATTFLPTAVKFHYNFNLRDIANIFTVYYKYIYIYII